METDSGGACAERRGGERRVTPLGELLADRIRRYGPITFADFMRECLYHPIHGYYSKAEATRFADYYTSVDVHPIFGRLLARQFAEMWEHLGRPEEFMLVEVGAGIGRLASDILDFSASTLSDFYRALNYVAVERSALRREQTVKRLKLHAERARAVISAEIPLHIPAGCFLTNELVDALPVHRVVVEGGAPKEIFVGFKNGQFGDHIRELSTCAITEYFATQRIVLLEGQHAEAGLEACDWITEVGRRLKSGYVLTIDYGHPAGDLFDEHHMRGTLLAYHDHRATENYYTSPGEQDLTAHVNFTALETWGKRSGLETAGLTSQTAFLLALGQRNEFTDLYDAGQTEADRIRARLQLKTLIHPEGMGERFQVLIQQKGTAPSQLTGLAGISHPA